MPTLSATDAITSLTHILFVGCVATAFMDAFVIARRRLLGTPSLDYAMVGRWLGHLPKGRFIHRPIGASEPVRGERLTGWIVHYLIGVIYAAALIVMAGPDWSRSPDLLPALAFGAVTVAAPFLILQPALGAGLAARRTPQPNLNRLRSLISHLVFGLGLWLAARLWAALVAGLPV